METFLSFRDIGKKIQWKTAAKEIFLNLFLLTVHTKFSVCPLVGQKNVSNPFAAD